jgi:DNA-binding transcriptional LysR family regulator
VSGIADDGPDRLLSRVIDRDSLRAFLAVASARSFTRAAEELYLSQPGLSSRVRRMEEGLGFRLFDRTTHHVRLTASGSMLLPVARLALDELETVADGLLPGGKPPENIHLGAPAYTATLPRRTAAVQQFEAIHPLSEVVIKNGRSGELLPLLREGKLDAAILFEPDDTEGLRTHLLYELPDCLTLPGDHRLGSREMVEVTDLAGEKVASWSRELNPRVHDKTFLRLVGAGADLVPIHGVQVEGVEEAAAALGIISVAPVIRGPGVGRIKRPLRPHSTSRIVMAAREESEWGIVMADFWRIMIATIRGERVAAPATSGVAI